MAWFQVHSLLPWCDYVQINDTQISWLYIISKREVTIIPPIITEKIKIESHFILSSLPRAGKHFKLFLYSASLLCKT